jgi:hypothetical protein
MQTSSFFLYEGRGRISIARYMPKHISGIASYPALAPGKWFKDPQNKTYEAYRGCYYQHVLARLDPQHTWDALHALAGELEPVLLCWEHLRKPEEWCHRRIVAEWFTHHLGVSIPEMPLLCERITQKESAQLSLFP